MRAVFALFFLISGVLHLVIPQTYMRVMPPYIPAPRAVVCVSGMFEILGGLGLLFPPVVLGFPVRKVSAWGLMALLIAVEPVHIYMVNDHNKFAAFPLWVLWVRLPLQLPLIWWAWQYTRKCANLR